MREIKFRVWNGKTMVYPQVIEIGINNINGLTSASYQLNGGGYCTSAYVMQSTNLKDKNGKDIYDGDIVILSNVLADGDKKICNAIMDGWQSLFESVEDGFYCFMGNTAQNYREVIGNIYENPELTPLH